MSITPISLRISPETRAVLDYLIERTGLKQAQVIRLALTKLSEKERTDAAAAAKPARSKR